MKRKTLTQEIGKVVFHEWFVKFNYPNEAGKPYREAGGELIDSDFGRVPKGWRIAALSEVADVIDCLHSIKPKRVLQDTGNTFLQLNNIRDDGLLDLSERYYITRDDYDFWISRIEASPGDCVITNVGRVGAVARIPNDVKAALGRNMTAVRCKKEFPYPFFLIGYLTSELYHREVAEKTDVGTVLNALNVKDISKLRLAIPKELDLVASINSFLSPIWRKAELELSFSNVLQK